MSIRFAESEKDAATSSGTSLYSFSASTKAQRLTTGQEDETLAFLAARPIHTVYMVGLILENGLCSPLNRGDFYCCRNAAGQLEGVALIGHATLIETHSNTALKAFVDLVKNNPRVNIIRGEEEMIEQFLSHYTLLGPAPGLICRELLFEQQQPALGYERVEALRPATLDELEQIITVNSEMIYEECGVNPLEADPDGFRERAAYRIKQERVWVWFEGDRLIFKADVIANTPEVIYLEGIHTNSQERGKGYGLRGLSQLCQQLLERTRSICLLVNEHNYGATKFYRKAGFHQRGWYDTVYLQKRIPSNSPSE
jgi:uncharacterized protein